MNIPDDLRYTESHEWVRAGVNDVTVGVTDHAQEQLTDVVFVQLPEVGEVRRRGEPICVVESHKSASDVYAPLGGTVVEVNERLATDPGLINTDPYGEGWIFRLEPSDPGEIEELRSPDDYRALIASS